MCAEWFIRQLLNMRMPLLEVEVPQLWHRSDRWRNRRSGFIAELLHCHRRWPACGHWAERDWLNLVEATGQRLAERPGVHGTGGVPSGRCPVLRQAGATGQAAEV